MTMTMTERMADYTLALKKSDLKPGVMELAKTFFIDCLGCIIAGGQEKPTLIALEYCKANFGAKPVAHCCRLGRGKSRFL